MRRRRASGLVVAILLRWSGRYAYRSICLGNWAMRSAAAVRLVS